MVDFEWMKSDEDAPGKPQHIHGILSFRLAQLVGLWFPAVDEMQLLVVLEVVALEHALFIVATSSVVQRELEPVADNLVPRVVHAERA